MKWGVVGFGSIGRRHTRNAVELGDEVVVLTRDEKCDFSRASSIENLVCDHKVNAVVVCNSTSNHIETYKKIRSIDKTLPLLVEKPVFHEFVDVAEDKNTFVAYCLRFHKLVGEVRNRIRGKKITAARFYVGQYLPDWRPDRDYRTTYSASKTLGGGALRDLSHELDLAMHLLGELQVKAGRISKVSNLEIDSDDYFTGMFKTESCESVLVELNYLDRIGRREFTLFTDKETLVCDFITGAIRSNNEVVELKVDPNKMYVDMLTEFKEKRLDSLSSLEDGLKILSLISKLEAGQI